MFRSLLVHHQGAQNCYVQKTEQVYHFNNIQLCAPLWLANKTQNMYELVFCDIIVLLIKLCAFVCFKYNNWIVKYGTGNVTLQPFLNHNSCLRADSILFLVFTENTKFKISCNFTSMIYWPEFEFASGGDAWSQCIQSVSLKGNKRYVQASLSVRDAMLNLLQ